MIFWERLKKERKKDEMKEKIKSGQEEIFDGILN